MMQLCVCRMGFSPSTTVKNCEWAWRHWLKDLGVALIWSLRLMECAFDLQTTLLCVGAALMNFLFSAFLR